MRPIFDPTAGVRARGLQDGSADPGVVTDPTAGERARSIRRLAVFTGSPFTAPPAESTPLVVDPTDPRQGLPADL